MQTRRRYLEAQVQHDLERKMVFVAGPRQVGKTTLAKCLPGAEEGYLNWDVSADRERILRQELPGSPLWIFDEIHKHRGWRDFLKGVFDGRPTGQRILVTGSARLEYYRFSGDSLQGRYHLLRLHPFSLAELGRDSLEPLLALGGFPEPFLGGSEVEARRWSREHRNLIAHEEIRTLEEIDDLGRLELLMLRLPDLVGSPLSVNAVREDLQIGYRIVANWLEVLERLYAIFRLAPFGAPMLRAVKKARKHYHFDWTVVPEPGLQFENLVACHLLKWVHHQQDALGLDVELRYFRDRDGREVDFVVTDPGGPVLLVECKEGDASPDKSLRYLKLRFPEAEAWQISARGTKDYLRPDGIRVAPAEKLLGRLV